MLKLARGNIVGVLKNRDFFALWVGQTISEFGDRLAQMGLVGLYLRMTAAFALSQVSHITVSARAPSLLEERPSKCPECGNTHIWKNGTYQVTGQRTSSSLLIREKGVVQRFRCAQCGEKLYLVKKKLKSTAREDRNSSPGSSLSP